MNDTKVTLKFQAQAAISKEERSSWPTGKAQRHATMTYQTTEHRSDTDITEKPSLNFTQTKN